MSTGLWRYVAQYPVPSLADCMTNRVLKRANVAMDRFTAEYAGNLKLNAQQVDEIIDRTFKEADTNQDGVIDFTEYQVISHRASPLTSLTSSNNGACRR